MSLRHQLLNSSFSTFTPSLPKLQFLLFPEGLWKRFRSHHFVLYCVSLPTYQLLQLYRYVSPEVSTLLFLHNVLQLSFQLFFIINDISFSTIKPLEPFIRLLCNKCMMSHKLKRNIISLPRKYFITHRNYICQHIL